MSIKLKLILDAMKAVCRLQQTQEVILEKIDELDSAVTGIQGLVGVIGDDYKNMIGLIADLQAKLEAQTKVTPDPVLQARISDLTVKASGTLLALRAIEGSFPVPAPPAPPVPDPPADPVPVVDPPAPAEPVPE